jgi:hypothetical protein
MQNWLGCGQIGRTTWKIEQFQRTEPTALNLNLSIVEPIQDGRAKQSQKIQ